MGKPTFLVRRVMSRLLGQTFMAYFLHLRPAEWPIMTAHFLLGTILSVGWRLPLGKTLLGWFVFVVLLNGGTLAINSAFDSDEGNIGYLREPPKPPRFLFQVSLGMLVLAFVLGVAFMPPVFAWSNGICAVMAVLYSVPPARLKSRAGWDLLVNGLGFGLLTPLAGWGLTARPLTGAFWWVGIGFGFLFGALYPLTQIYQIDEDASHGDRTLAVKLGTALTLGLCIGLAVAAHACFVASALKLGRNPLLVLTSLAAWLFVLIPWLAHWKRWTYEQHESGMYHALYAWAVTDVCVLVLLWP